MILLNTHIIFLFKYLITMRGVFITRHINNINNRVISMLKEMDQHIQSVFQPTNQAKVLTSEVFISLLHLYN